MKKIITISREFGSGGRELGKKLAEKMNFKFYDKEKLSFLIQKYGYDARYIDSIDKIGNDDFPFRVGNSFMLYSVHQKQATELLVLEQKLIKELASKNNCVFVGRGADLILKECDPLNIFVFADDAFKIERCKQNAKENENLNDKQILKQIKSIDKSRQKHYLLLGSDSWGQRENYDVCLNMSRFEIDDLVSVVEGLANEFFKEKK